MLELHTLSQWQPNVSPQSGWARTSLGTEEPQMPFISMAAQTGAGPGPGEERREPPSFLRWLWQGCQHLGSEEAEGVHLEHSRDERQTWGRWRSRLGQGPRNRRESTKWARKGARDPEAVHKTRQEKGKRQLHVREKLDKDGEGGLGQTRGPVSDKQSGREEKPPVKDKRIRSQELETGPKKCNRVVRKGKTNEREEKNALWQRTKTISFQSWDLKSMVLSCTCATTQGPPPLTRESHTEKHNGLLPLPLTSLNPVPESPLRV